MRIQGLRWCNSPLARFRDCGSFLGPQRSLWASLSIRPMSRRGYQKGPSLLLGGQRQRLSQRPLVGSVLRVFGCICQRPSGQYLLPWLGYRERPQASQCSFGSVPSICKRLSLISRDSRGLGDSTQGPDSLFGSTSRIFHRCIFRKCNGERAARLLDYRQVFP